MNRDAWLRRFRARLHSRNPSIPDDVSAVLGEEAYDALMAKYPDDPEKAFDDAANELPERHK